MDRPRERAWARPREGTATLTLRADGKTLDVATVGKSDGAAFKETAVIVWDEATKTLAFSERLANGTQIQSKATGAVRSRSGSPLIRSR